MQNQKHLGQYEHGMGKAAETDTSLHEENSMVATPQQHDKPKETPDHKQVELHSPSKWSLQIRDTSKSTRSYHPK